MNKKSIIYILIAVILAIAYFLNKNPNVFKAENNDNKILVETKKSENKSGNSAISGEEMLPTSTTGAVVFHDNYSLSYNEKYEQAEWVFYELKNRNVSNNNFQRPYFIFDPKVKTQSADYRNYKNSGYDRGHLCPAGDMKFSKEAFDETFYTSNISPQKNDFNGGVWNRLEQKTRYWSQKYNDIYVVTGGILTEGLETIGREKVAVPKYFYKILMDETDGEFKMIAFLVPHESSKKPLYEFVVSVDEIEKLTGIDFFPGLPDTIENELEQRSDYKSWSF
ncbi:DNA/RNA non-specific endonuclease [Flavobacterium qiangtangense]|uniref:Endonuclease n=1 Tax=Flavobacterium qiangtangense TaxID=1442595 RepID=A0ABW1PN58_9FLAO